MHRQKKGAKYGQKRKRRKERNTRYGYESISHAKFATFAKAVEPILKTLRLATPKVLYALCFATCRLQCSARLCASRFADGEMESLVLRDLLIAR